MERESDVTSMKGTFLNKGKSVCLAAAVKGVRKTPLLIMVEPSMITNEYTRGQTNSPAWEKCVCVCGGAPFFVGVPAVYIT